MITIFTDGSSRGNPGPGGWATIIKTDDRVLELGGRENETTNNRMEMTAAIKALETASSLELLASSLKIRIYTDAEYLLKGITVWIHGWQKNNWRNSQKKPVMNDDLWKRLLELTECRDIEWKLVRGHAGVAGNDRCDEIATSFADNIDPGLYDGPLSGYKVDLSHGV